MTQMMIRVKEPRRSLAESRGDVTPVTPDGEMTKASALSKQTRVESRMVLDEWTPEVLTALVSELDAEVNDNDAAIDRAAAEGDIASADWDNAHGYAKYRTEEWNR